MGVRRSWSFPDCMADCGEQPGGVVVIESGDGVSEAGGNASGKTEDELGDVGRHAVEDGVGGEDPAEVVGLEDGGLPIENSFG
jgi:hypothetical protein